MEAAGDSASKVDRVSSICGGLCVCVCVCVCAYLLCWPALGKGLREWEHCRIMTSYLEWKINESEKCDTGFFQCIHLIDQNFGPVTIKHIKIKAHNETSIHPHYLSPYFLVFTRTNIGMCETSKPECINRKWQQFSSRRQ